MKQILLHSMILSFCFSTTIASAESYKGHLEKIEHSYTPTKVEEKHERLDRAVYTLASNANINAELEVIFEEVVGNETYISWSNLSMPERETIKYKITVHFNDESYTYQYANLEPEQRFWLTSKEGESILVRHRHIEKEKRPGIYQDDPAEYYDVNYLEIGNHETKNLIGAYSNRPIFKLELNKTRIAPEKKSNDFRGE